MTLEDIKAMKTDVIPPATAAAVLKCRPYSINLAARDCPETLGFPVIRIGSRVKIPRLAFIRYMEGGGGEE